MTDNQVCKPIQGTSRVSQKRSGQHTIPRFYLSHFTIPETPKGHLPSFWVYDIEASNPSRPRKRNPKNVAKTTDFYSQTTDARVDYVLEDMLMGIESESALLLTNLISFDLPLDDVRTRYGLARFISLLAFRTPQFQEHFQFLFENNVKARVVDTFKARSGLQKVLEDFNRGSSCSMTPTEFLKEFNNMRIRPNKKTFHSFFVESARLMIPKLASMKWHMLRSEQGAFFITSDAPVVFEDDTEDDPTLKYGYLRKSIRIIFPIHRNLCLLAGWTGRDGYYPVNRDVVWQMNSSIAANAGRYLFSPFLHEVSVERKRYRRPIASI